MYSSNIKAIITLQIFFFVAVLPCMAWEKVSFRHKTVEPPKFKVECRKIKGRHDAYPTYRCYDKEGNSEAFDPGNEWEEVTIENVCFRHKDRDNIRGCMKFKGIQDKIEHVGCVDAKGNLIIFSPDPIKWEELDADNPDCKPHIIEMDVPKGTIDLVKVGSQECLEIGIITETENCIEYEQVLDYLKEAPLAYNKPDRMIRGDPTEISLILDTTNTKDPTIELSGTEGEIIEGKSKISRYMSAELSGVDFKIEPIGPQRRLVTTYSPIRWTWKVIPHEAGENKILTLDVFAHIQINDQISDPITVRTYRNKFSVDVKTWDRVVEAVNAIQPIHALIVALVGSGWAMFMWWRKREVKAASKGNRKDD